MEHQTFKFIYISHQIKHICLRYLTLNVIWGILDCYFHFVDIVRCVNFTNIVVSCSSHSIQVRTQYYNVWYMNTNILSNFNRHVSFKLSEERETRCTSLFFESKDVYIVSKKELNTMDENFLFLYSSFDLLLISFIVHSSIVHIFSINATTYLHFYSLSVHIITQTICTYSGKH